jgi:phosphoribosylglycinamide formyltransferase-1
MALRLAVLISGKGSNLLAIADAIAHGECPATIALVVSDRDSAGGVALARARGIDTAVVKLGDYADRDSWNRALTERVAEAEPDLIVGAGFMKLVSGGFLQRFPRRVINIHPALLPLFPGVDGPAQALAAGVRVSGCTVHMVDEGVDAGPIIAQAVVPVLPDDDVARLHERIQRTEHVLLPRVIAAIARAEVALDPELRVRAGSDAQQTLFSIAQRSS